MSDDATVPRLDRGDLLVILLLILAALPLYVWGIGSYPLGTEWEPKYARALVEMKERGDLFTPWYKGQIRFAKPILTYWAMIPTTALYGITEFSVRLPSAVAAIAGVIVLYGAVRKLRGRTTGMVAAAVLMTTPLYMHMGRRAMPDMLMTCFIAAAMCFLALARFSGFRRRLNLFLFYGAVALGILTKGPVVAAIVVASILLFESIDLVLDVSLERFLPRLRELWSLYQIHWGILIVLVIAGPWYGGMLWRHGREFFDAFVVGENLHRFERPVREHYGMGTHYVQALLQGAYPWVALLPVGILFYFRGTFGVVDEDIRQKWFFFSWFLGIFSIFTLAATKITHYILPIVPAFAVMIAILWENYFRERSPHWFRLALLSSIPLLFIPIRDFLHQGGRFENYTLPAIVSEVGGTMPLYGILFSWGAAMVVAVLTPGSRAVVALVVFVAYANTWFLAHNLLPPYMEHHSVTRYLDEYEARKDPGAELVYFGKILPAIRFYCGEKGIPLFTNVDRLTEYLASRGPVTIMTPSSNRPWFASKLQEGTNSVWSLRSPLHSDSEYDLYVQGPPVTTRP